MREWRTLNKIAEKFPEVFRVLLGGFGHLSGEFGQLPWVLDDSGERYEHVVHKEILYRASDFLLVRGLVISLPSRPVGWFLGRGPAQSRWIRRCCIDVA